jgi:ribosomal protein L11 methyltransferase
MDQFRAMRFGERLWIYPSNVEPPADGDAVVVRLDPGLAFGTGTHATTALCLEWLDRLFAPAEGAPTAGVTVGGASAPMLFAQGAGAEAPPARVLDYGCGSGVLAIAAVKLGAASATGVDNDPQALLATRDNAQRNAVADRIVALEPGDPALAPAAYDVVVANILAGALVALAPTIAALAKPGAPIALSGILPEQADEVIAAWEPWCEGLAASERDGWIRVDGTRRR